MYRLMDLCVCTQPYIHTQIIMYVCLYINIHQYSHENIFGYTHACLATCMHTLHTYIYTYKSMHVCLDTGMSTYIHSYRLMHVCACTHICMSAHLYTYICMCIHTYMDSCEPNMDIQMKTHVSLQTCIHIQIFTHVCLHAYIHTYIYHGMLLG